MFNPQSDPMRESRLRKMITSLIILISLVSIPVCLPVMAVENTSATKSEIAYLLSYIEKSGCQFCRNGAWYHDTKAVRNHVEMKYRYFTGKIDSTEDFIEWAASKSEISGKPYLVKCEAGVEMPLSKWLTDELVLYRKERGAERGLPGEAAGR